MEERTQVLEYKCPCCDAGLKFSALVQRLKCEYCDNEFNLDTVKAYNDGLKEDGAQFSWDPEEGKTWDEGEEAALRSFLCPTCSGEIMTDENTAATFCPYCGNPTILSTRVSGGLRPDGVIPFQTTKEDAKAAFLKLCKGKPLLPKLFTQEQQVEKISGMYIPFWLYDCGSAFRGSYKATRVRHWSDANYNYTKTDHYHLERAAQAEFVRIPMDASKKMDNAIMESIEPFDYGKLVDFETAYLSGFLADKYDVQATEGEERVRQRVSNSMEAMIQQSMVLYTTAVPMGKKLDVTHGRAKYVLLPVWMLSTRYKDKTYLFAMNGQSGKMTGSFPICPKRTAMWFTGVFAGAAALVSVLQLLIR